MQTLSFDEVKAEVDILARSIAASGFKPDYIVGITRGGWIPTRLLAGALSIKKILSLGVMYEDAARTKPAVYSRPDPFPENEKLLLVEDCLEKGEVLRFAVRQFADLNEVRSSSLFVTEKTAFIPDFYNRKLEAPPRFPWE